MKLGFEAVGGALIPRSVNLQILERSTYMYVSGYMLGIGRCFRQHDSKSESHYAYESVVKTVVELPRRRKHIATGSWRGRIAERCASWRLLGWLDGHELAGGPAGSG